ncbi:MAG: hypothetical protein WAZ12_05305 [Candidatus Absconditicoccaceae bacterium]
MKKYLILPIFIFILFGFSYAADCDSLSNQSLTLEGEFNDCVFSCTDDKTNGIIPSTTDCINVYCLSQRTSREAKNTELEECLNPGSNNINERKTRCPTIANQIDENTINFINEVGGLCCFYNNNMQPKCTSLSDGSLCFPTRTYTSNGVTLCCDNDLMAGVCPINNAGDMGIEMSPDCLINGQCKFDIYQTLGIRQSLPRETRSSPGIFVQDIILSATFFVGTLITGVLIISGLLFVFAGVNAGLADKAKKGITGSLIGLLFVVGSYAFVRLIQFLVTGGGG